MLQPGQKLSISWDDSGDQPEAFPNGYYIAVVLQWHGDGWVNTGRVFHVAELAELDDLLREDTGPRAEALAARFPAGTRAKVRRSGALVDGALCVVVKARIQTDGPMILVRLLGAVGTMPAGERLRLAPDEVERLPAGVEDSCKT